MVSQPEELDGSRPSGYAELAKEITPSVYAVHAISPENKQGPRATEKGFPLGSAVCVSPDGICLTATQILNEIKSHFESAGIEYDVGLTGKSMKSTRETVSLRVSEIIKSWPEEKENITVLKVNTNDLEHLSARTQGEPEAMGQPVATFGYSENEVIRESFRKGNWRVKQHTFAGVISSDHAFGNQPHVYDVDAVFTSGLSGGPLISIRTAEVIGIVTGALTFRKEQREGDSPRLGHVTTASSIHDFDNKPEHLDRVGERLEEFGVHSSRNT